VLYWSAESEILRRFALRRAVQRFARAVVQRARIASTSLQRVALAIDCKIVTGSAFPISSSACSLCHVGGGVGCFIESKMGS